MKNDNTMKYDFDKEINRRGTRSYKWDSTSDAAMLPLWVADMDFQTAPPVIEALERRVAHGIFGYTRVPDEYYDALCAWFSRRHGFAMQRDWIIYTSGVVPALSAIIKAMTREGDKVIVQTPVYNCFFSSIRNNGCQVVESPLLPQGDSWVMDYDLLERQAADERAKVMVLCNPHNPAGRVWTAGELQRLGEICLRHGVFVISDEIHCELTAPGIRYTPFASLSQEFLMHSATCTSPSKAFNLAGLQIANICVADAAIRRRVDKAININEVCDVNPFGVEALMAAYNHGGEWLDALNVYLHDNYEYMAGWCRRHLPQLPLSRLEGTYLVWMDCRCLGMSSDVLEEALKEQAHLWLNSGAMYGRAGEGYMRWNIACPRTRLEEALRRFEAFVKARQSQK